MATLSDRDRFTHSIPETKEVAPIARREVGFESAWIFPISEPFTVAIRSPAQCQDKGQENNTNDDGDFDRTEPELEFAKELDAKVVDANNGDPEDCDENTRIDSISRHPELEHKRACGELVRCNDDVFEPVSALVSPVS